MKNRGGARSGSGRKANAVEEDVKSAIKKAIESDPEAITTIWSKIIEKAKAGSDKHAQIFLNYYYGKPKESISVDGGFNITLTRKVVTK